MCIRDREKTAPRRPGPFRFSPCDTSYASITLQVHRSAGYACPLSPLNELPLQRLSSLGVIIILRRRDVQTWAERGVPCDIFELHEDDREGGFRWLMNVMRTS